MQFKFVQMTIAPGEPAVNFETMKSQIVEAKKQNVEVLVFPEMCVSGYLIGDRWEFEDFTDDIQSYHLDLLELSEGITLIWGSVLKDTQSKGENGRYRLYNAWFACIDQKFLSSFNGLNGFPKVLSPNYRLFDESRYFYDLRKVAQEESKPVESYLNPIKIGEYQVGITLCEDGWDTDYSHSPIEVLANKDADLIVNLSCSPFSLGKSEKRERLFQNHSDVHDIPVVYLNGYSFQNTGKTFYFIDGNSTIYHSKKSYHPLKWGTAGEFELSLNKDGVDFEGTNIEVPKVEERILTTLKASIKDYLDKSGLKKVVIGASGGVDSAVNAALFAEVIGPENLLLVNMPSRFNSDLTKGLAFELAQNIGCWYCEVSIEESVEVSRQQMAHKEIKRKDQTKTISLSEFHFENVQARDRSARILSALACSFGGVFTCNANKAEMTVGYSTLYGDLGGFLAPLADLWKHQVYELGKTLNRNKEIIPQGVFDIVPSAELSENHDVEAGLGDPIVYEYHDYLFRSWTERWESASPSLILEWYKNGVLEKELGMETKLPDFFKVPKVFIEDLEKWYGLFCGLGQIKRIQSPPIVTISRRPYGFDWREAVLKPYYGKKFVDLRRELIEKESI